MAQQMKTLSTKCDSLNWTPKTHMMEARINSHKLSLAHMLHSTHMHMRGEGTHAVSDYNNVF